MVAVSTHTQTYPDGDSVTLFDASIDYGMVACGQDITEIQGLFIWDIVRDRKKVDVPWSPG